MTQYRPDILIIDDDEFLRDIISEYLNEVGHKVVEAENGQEGLVKFQANKPDLVLLDLRMPKFDGLQVLESLVKNAPNIPVIIISGEGTMEDVIKALRLGAWDYIIKPIHDFKLLSYSIEKAYERACLIRQNEENRYQLKKLNQQLETKVEERTEQLKTALDELDDANLSLKKQNIETIRMLSRIIELRPGLYKGHSKFVAEKSALIAKELGLDESEVQSITVAGLLLQIGKMSVSEKILSKPFYNMQSFERSEFLQHALEGEKLLAGMEHLKNASYLIRCQYEKYDGTGFPDGLKGEKIPIGTRILVIMRDFFNYNNGITTGKRMVASDVINQLMRFKGKTYDPEILEMFVTIVTGRPYQPRKLVVETEWFRLQEGMQIAQVKYKGTMYIKNVVATEEIIEQIKKLRDEVGAGLIIKVQVR